LANLLVSLAPALPTMQVKGLQLSNPTAGKIPNKIAKQLANGYATTGYA
jgi:hypothetical protein